MKKVAELQYKFKKGDLVKYGIEDEETMRVWSLTSSGERFPNDKAENLPMYCLEYQINCGEFKYITVWEEFVHPVV